MKSEGTEGTAIRARSSARKADETFEHLAGQAEASPKVNWDKWTLAEDGTWERTYAEYTHVTLEARKILRLSQVRNSRNPAFDELWESIESTDMINQPSVSRLDVTQLSAYIEATNFVWKAERKIEEFMDFLHPDGFFYLTAAGHTRIEATIASTNEVERSTGRPARAKIECSVNRAVTPLEIMSTQISENKYSAPSPELRAVAVVEAFYFGLATGEYKSKGDFINKSNGLVSADVLRDALAFMELPENARQHVFHKDLHYSSGVIIGAASDKLREWARITGKFTPSVKLTPRLKKKYEQIYELKIGDIVAHIKSKELSATRARQYLKNVFEDVDKDIVSWTRAWEGTEDMLQPEIFDFFVNPLEEAEAVVKQMRRAHMEVRRQIAKGPARAAARFLIQDAQLTGVDVKTDPVIHDLIRANELLTNQIGERGMLAVIAAEELSVG